MDSHSEDMDSHNNDMDQHTNETDSHADDMDSHTNDLDSQSNETNSLIHDTDLHNNCTEYCNHGSTPLQTRIKQFQEIIHLNRQLKPNTPCRNTTGDLAFNYLLCFETKSFVPIPTATNE
ncbi:hypothetical protein DPMN_136907 [Dreissena polymorpha]|uniref:Uncharacterized protein n=1 Tax=Dreissena polymorpha TaxID=45954 RepID=A0A9D4JE86_DREPO|nr:hypothetical protein DPMN_136907 [Dreissena polymorpha]